MKDVKALLVRYKRDITETTALETARKSEFLGDEQYTKFVEGRLELCTKLGTDTRSKKRLPLFSHPHTRHSTCRLYISYQSHDLLHDLKSDQTETTSAPEVDATIGDREAVVQMLNPALAKNFEE